MADLIRDAPIGQLIRFLTRNRYLQYPEERSGFQLPQRWQLLLDDRNIVNDTPVASSSSTVHVREGSNTPCMSEKEAETGQQSQSPHEWRVDERDRVQQQPLQLHRTRSQTKSPVLPVPKHAAEEDCPATHNSAPAVPRQANNGTILVDWYYNDDRENPHNWSNRKRVYLTGVLCLYTFIVYTTSAIYTSYTEGIMEEFGVSQLKSSLGLAIYVLGYALVFPPLSEIPRIGRNPIYVATMFLFVIISIPTAFAPSYSGLMILRFLQGGFGSPCIASSGASLGDMYSLTALPFAMLAWVSAAFCAYKYLSAYLYLRKDC